MVVTIRAVYAPRDSFGTPGPYEDAVMNFDVRDEWRRPAAWLRLGALSVAWHAVGASPHRPTPGPSRCPLRWGGTVVHAHRCRATTGRLAKLPSPLDVSLAEQSIGEPDNRLLSAGRQLARPESILDPAGSTSAACQPARTAPACSPREIRKKLADFSAGVENYHRVPRASDGRKFL